MVFDGRVFRGVGEAVQAGAKSGGDLHWLDTGGRAVATDVEKGVSEIEKVRIGARRRKAAGYRISLARGR